MNISWLTYCMGRRDELEQFVARALRVIWPNDELVIVDYGDPDNSGEWAAALPDARLTVLLVWDIKFFHIDHARNLALRASRGPICTYCDCDFLLTEDTVSECHTLPERSFMIQPDAVHSYGFLCAARAALMEIQGHEEAVCGYGADDTMMKERCTAFDLKRIGMKHSFQTLGKTVQVRMLQTDNIGRNANVNHRILRTLRALHPYKNNVGRNWGWGGTILRQSAKPAQEIPSVVDEKARPGA